MNISQVILDGFIAALVGVLTALAIISIVIVALIKVIGKKFKGTMFETMITSLFPNDWKSKREKK